MGGTEKGGTGILNNAGHRINRENPRIFSGDAGRIYDWGEKHKHLNKVGKNKSNITVFYINGGEKKSKSDGSHKTNKKKKWNEKYTDNIRVKSVIKHHSNKNNRGNCKIYKLSEDGGNR